MTIYSLTEREAFAAMSLFLDQWLKRAGTDLLALTSDIALDPDGGTFDPAAWEDWMDCVETVKSSPE